MPTKPTASAKALPGPGSGREALLVTKPRPSVDSQRDAGSQPSFPKSKAVLKVDSLSADSATAGPDTAKPSAAPALHLVDGQEATRVAVPSAAEQEAAMKQAQDLYRDEFAKAKTPKTREALATELLAKAKQQAAGDAAGAFVLLRLTRDLAVQAGDGATAISAIDAMTEKFELDGLAMKTDVLADLARKAHMPVDHLSIAQQAADLMDDAFAAGNYPQAAHLGKLATAEGQKAHDRDIVLQARSRLKEVQGAIKLGEDFQAARTKLADQPDDADANTIAASYYCFLKNDWDKGLPYLAKGHDATLKALAQRELQEKPKDPADRVKLADAWWDLAQKADSRRKEKMLLHAGAWYAKAQPALPAGMVKLKVEKRLDEIERLDRKSTTGGLSPRCEWRHPTLGWQLHCHLLLCFATLCRRLSFSSWGGSPRNTLQVGAAVALPPLGWRSLALAFHRVYHRFGHRGKVAISHPWRPSTAALFTALKVRHMDIQQFFIEFQDFLAPKLDTYEQAIYLYIFRHSRLIDVEEVTIGFQSARRKMACGVGGKGTDEQRHVIVSFNLSKPKGA